MHEEWLKAIRRDMSLKKRSGLVKQWSKSRVLHPKRVRPIPLPNKKSIVLVDDEIDIVTVLKHSLELNCYEVHDFHDPAKALEYVKTTDTPIDLLITDIRMPRITGFELAREVNKCRPEIMIMLLTAYEIDSSEIKNALLPSTKIDACINKPVHLYKLVDAVNALMVSKMIAHKERVLS